MGMTCTFVALSERDLPYIESKSFILLTFGDTAIDPEILGLTEADTQWQPTVKPRTLDVDKAWDGMNFLLNKAGGDTGFPYTFITEGGIEFEDESEWGYGPPHAFDAEEVQQIAATLKEIDIDALNQLTEPQDLIEAEVYCMSPDSPEESMGYFTHHLSELKTFIAATAADNLALVVYLA